MEVDEQENYICTICFDDYTSTGNHRPASLKCGHIFGLECIKRWIASKDRCPTCPQCNAKTRMFQVRILYFSNVKLVDTQERDTALKNYENEKELRKTIELEYQDLRGKYENLNSEFIHIKQQLKALESKNSNITRDILKAALAGNVLSTHTENLDGHSGKYIIAVRYNISSEANNRCFGLSPFNRQICVTDYVSSPLFNSWGIKKISNDFKSFKFISLHSQMIRGVAFPRDVSSPYILTASADKKVKLTNLSNDQVGLTVECPTQVWSVAWNDDGPDGFFAGCSTGAVLLFDIRQPNKPIHTFNPAKDMVSAVHSLNYLPRRTDGFQGGILVGQLNGFTYLEADKTGGTVRESDNICSFTRQPSIPSQRSSQTTITPPPLSSYLPNPNDIAGFNDNDDDLFTVQDEDEDDNNNPDVQMLNNGNEQQIGEILRSWPKYHYRGLSSQKGLVSLSAHVAHDKVYFLNSFRSGSLNIKVRHIINEFHSFGSKLTGNNQVVHTEVHSLKGGTQHVPIFRSKIFPRGNDQKILALSGDQATNSALLWRCDTGDLIQQFQHPAIKESNPVVDAISLDQEGKNLALLTKKDLLIYEWNQNCK